MPKVAVVGLANSEAPGDLGRVVNALETTKECIEAGDDIQLIFDGAGTTWIPALAASDHPYHGLYDSLKPHITGACDYCANAYGVNDAVESEGLALISEYDGHPSIRSLVTGGYQVLTF